MSYRVVMDGRAAQELDEALVYYASISQPLAASLLAAFEEAAGFLKNFPKGGTPAGERLRRKSLRGFPYYLLYDLSADAVRILAVAHVRRDISIAERGSLS